MKKIFPTYTLPTFVIVLGYLASLSLAFQAGKVVTGLCLTLILPGLLFNQLIGLNKYLPKPAIIFGFAVSGSIIYTAFLFIIYRNYSSFNQTTFITINLATVFALLVLLLIQKKRNPKEEKPLPTDSHFLPWVIALTPLIFFIIRLYLNPYLVDQDGAMYVSIMKEVERLHSDTSFLSGARYLFTFIVMQIHYVTGLSFVAILKFILPGFFWLSLSSLLLWIQKKERYWLLLVPLASAAFIGQVDRFKPEILAMFCIIPAVSFFGLALKEKRNGWKFFLLGLICGLVASRSHQFGVILLVSYLLALAVYGITIRHQLKSYLTLKYLFFGFIIILPYLLLFNVGSLFVSLKQALTTFIPGETTLHFQWWFLGSYSSQGSQGWPGWSFLIFYIFNGSLIVFIIAAILYKNKKNGAKTTQLVSLSLLSIYAAVFLLLAEILPRIGIYALPDRAWVELFFALSIILIFLLSESEYSHKVISFLIIAHICGGVLVSSVLALTSGSLVSKDEQPVIDAINHLPQNAIILSPQEVNETLVLTYTNRDFFPVTFPEEILKQEKANPHSLEPFKTYIEQLKNNEKIVNKFSLSAPIEKRETITIQTRIINNTGFTNSNTTEKTTTKTPIPLPLLENSSGNRPIYLLFSFSKTDGLLSKTDRSSWSSASKSSDRDIYENLSGPDIVFKDKAAVLVRIF